MHIRSLYPLVAALLLSSCSTGPSKPAAGTPAFYWSAALETYQAGDYQKTIEHLGRLTRSANEFTAQSHPMRVTVLAGLMLGYQDLAEHYEYGGRANKANPTPFRTHLADTRSAASRLATQLSEAYGEFERAVPEAEVTLGFPFPSRGSLALPPQMSRIAKGVMPASEDEIRGAQLAMLQRGVVEAVSRAAGAAGDAPKTMEMLKAPPVKVPRATFVAGMADCLYDASTLFDERKDNQPRIQQHLLSQAEAALKTAGDSDPVKKLRKKIEADVKKIAKRLPK